MLRGRYTLFSRIPVYICEDEFVFSDPLWVKDLELHFQYIEKFFLCCPAQHISDPPKNAKKIYGLTADKVRPLRKDIGWGSTLINIVPNFLVVAKAVRESHIVHSGGSGWAFPLSFYILLLRRFSYFKWLIIIESSFWMRPAAKRATPREWIRHELYRVLLGACLRRADACVFTTEYYRRFFKIDMRKSLIAPAVWVDEENVISEDELKKRLLEITDSQVRFIFPARLIPDKGITTILSAAKKVEKMIRAGMPKIVIDIVGAGPLAESCRTYSRTFEGSISLNVLDPVPYGSPFFQLLQNYEAILLANRKHEQPRVIFDGFSQGVPVISSRTFGVRDIVVEGESALLYDVDDVDGLAGCLIKFASDKGLRIRMAECARKMVLGHTHVAMHETREKFLFSRNFSMVSD